MSRPAPPGLPDRLTISLWDFSWYVRTGPGEPFEDLDVAFAAAVERGYNTVRVCAMPFLLFGSGLPTDALRLGPMGDGYAQRVRWYDVAGETTIDARAHLLELFRAARRHGCHVIVSSWEYQQSPAFALEPDWYEALDAVPADDRAAVLGEALADLVDLLVEEGLDDRVAYVEIHNEVQVGHLTAGLGVHGDDAVVALRPRLQRGVDAFHARHPQRWCTVNYAGVPHGAWRGLPEDVDVVAVHPYVYGVLQQMVDELGLRGPVEGFDAAAAAPLLRAGAPPVERWSVPEADRWKLRAMIVSLPEIYLHDWCDPEAYDRWLYDRYGAHRLAMAQKLTLWLESAADAAAARDVPLVLGEGWVGYTPLHSWFEEGPVGAEICRTAVAEAHRVGAWGTVVCSNAAPQHPMWGEVALQQQCNDHFRSGSTTTPSG